MPSSVYPTLKDRVIIITGGGQALGRAYAHAFAEQGAIPVIAELEAEKGDRVVSEITQKGGRAFCVPTDISNQADVEDMVEKTIDKYGRVDCLINNAAVFSKITIAPFWELPVDEWKSAMEVNINGAFYCSRAVVPIMQEHKWGRIINIASTTVPTGRPNYLHYITSKSAMIGMTRSMARELGDWNITVHLFMPGAVETEVERPSVSGAMFQNLAQQQALKRPATMDEYAGFMLWLCSDDAEFTTGQTFAANGGIAFP
ncbi:MAG: SDR family oxidoreductase [Rhodospirillaceae bacterium]